MPSSHTRGGGGLFLSSLQSSVRKGVLPSMLEEILRTRIMVKQSMKAYKQEKALMKLLDARQLGLKLIANVTFGYAAANYSGRMPCVEVSPESRRVPNGGAFAASRRSHSIRAHRLHSRLFGEPVGRVRARHIIGASLSASCKLKRQF